MAIEHHRWVRANLFERRQVTAVQSVFEQRDLRVFSRGFDQLDCGRRNERGNAQRRLLLCLIHGGGFGSNAFECRFGLPEPYTLRLRIYDLDTLGELPDAGSNACSGAAACKR